MDDFLRFRLVKIQILFRTHHPISIIHFAIEFAEKLTIFVDSPPSFIVQIRFTSRVSTYRLRRAAGTFPVRKFDEQNTLFKPFSHFLKMYCKTSFSVGQLRGVDYKNFEDSPRQKRDNEAKNQPYM